MKLQTQDIRIAMFTTDTYKEIIRVLSLQCLQFIHLPNICRDRSRHIQVSQNPADKIPSKFKALTAHISISTIVMLWISAQNK